MKIQRLTKGLEDNINSFLTNELLHPYHLDEFIPSFRGFFGMFSFLLHFP